MAIPGKNSVSAAPPDRGRETVSLEGATFGEILMSLETRTKA